MMVLTNGLTDTVDEGFLKVANSLIHRLKKERSEVEIVSYERKSEITDVFVKTNKLLINKRMICLCKKHESVLYIPFPAREWATAMRVFLLSRICPQKVRVLLTMKCQCGLIGRLMLKYSGAEIITLSRGTVSLYTSMIGEKRVTYLKTGVDTQKFAPVSTEQAAALKLKYGFDPNKKLVLHVGHLNEGRNIRHLTKIKDEYQVLLVTSTLTKAEEDQNLKKDLLSQSNIRIMDNYIPHIEEIYQMADVYFFPVVESGHCIDVPLSCLEAAACNKPIITTEYGEMQEFIGKDGFYSIHSFDADSLNALVGQAAMNDTPNTRAAVLEYDWEKAVDFLLI